MAQINKPNQYFNTKLYTGTGSTQSITGVGFQPDWVWVKCRSNADGHVTSDSVRGANKQLFTNTTDQEFSATTQITSFNSDGFSLGTDSGVNGSGRTFASWNWSAGGTAPSKTYTVKVVSDSGNKYRFDDFGTSAVTLEISEGGTFRFDQADSSNSGHPLRFSTTSDGTHGGGSEYTTGVTTVGTPGSAGAYTEITVAASAPTLYYYCSVHSGMGGQANTPTTNSFSSFDGSIQSNVSPNTTAGFSIVSYTGNGTAGATVGHGLGTTPAMVIVKNRSEAFAWNCYHQSLGATKYILLNATDASATGTTWNNTAPTSSVFSIGSTSGVNKNTNNLIAYCFAEKKGYSKFGSYTGNGNADGTFVYTGFKPAFIIVKESSVLGDNWRIVDNKRLGYNQNNYPMYPSASTAEGTEIVCDMLSNGFKLRSTGGGTNQSGQTYIYMAFAENPLVGTNNIPTTAR